QVSAHKLKIPTWRVNSYLEAVGVLVAHKAGINPFSLMI
ncbi:MAG: DUF3326 domain-containing protein, partial [Dolichospermum sp.]